MPKIGVVKVRPAPRERVPTAPVSVSAPDSPPEDWSHWVATEFRCRCQGCGGERYPARRYGPWVTFEHAEVGWELIHVGTNLAAVTGMRTPEDCFRVGDFLQRAIPLVLRLDDVAAMRERLGPERVAWVGAWTRACKARRKFVAPPPIPE